MGFLNNVMQRHSGSLKLADLSDELGDAPLHRKVVLYGLVRSVRANQRRPFFGLSYSAVPSDLENSHPDTMDRQSRSLLGLQRESAQLLKSLAQPFSGVRIQIYGIWPICCCDTSYL